MDLLQREITEHRARQSVLHRLREEMEGFSAATKQLLQETNVTALYEQITPLAGAEKAFSVVMRPYTQTLVTKTKKDFEDVLAYAKQHNLQDFSLVCLEHLPSHDTTQKKEGLLQFLLRVSGNALSRHFLNNVYVAGDHETALSCTDQDIEIWTDDQAFVDRRKVIFFTGPGENNVFMREAEIKTLEEKLNKLEQQHQRLADKYDLLKKNREQKQTERQQLDNDLRQQEMGLLEINYSQKRLQTECEKAQQEITQHIQAIEELDQSTKSIEGKLAQLTEEHTEAKKKVVNIQNQSDQFNQELDKLVELLKGEQRDLEGKEASYLEVLEENRKLQHTLNVFEVKDLENAEYEKRLQEEIRRSQELQEQIKQKEIQYQELLKEVDQKLEQITTECAEFEKTVTHKKQAIEEIEQKVETQRTHRRELEDELHQIAIQRTHVESSQHALKEELSEFYNLAIEELLNSSEPLEIPMAQAEKEIRSLRRQIEVAGDINMTSIEEFDQLKVRYEFLQQQIQDLENTKEELLQIINQLDTESRKIFKETFEQIRANFQKNFKILFRGGDADLQLTESSDILEAGIEIIAKPPGKQMRSISLLSGGEKCLTAIALLFAIFEVKPAPFCILDEIDAPLDDTNIERFLEVVKQFLDKCQFIIITHNKRTMAMADRLFGVTMEEKGVSKLLSLTFTDKSEPVLV